MAILTMPLAQRHGAQRGSHIKSCILDFQRLEDGKPKGGVPSPSALAPGQNLMFLEYSRISGLVADPDC